MNCPPEEARIDLAVSASTRKTPAREDKKPGAKTVSIRAHKRSKPSPLPYAAFT